MNDISALESQLANCRDYWLGWGALDRQDGNPTYYRSGLADAQLNGVLRLQDGARTQEALAESIERFHGVPWRWWVGPDSGSGVRRKLVADVTKWQ